jgi:hypothetical protein
MTNYHIDPRLRVGHMKFPFNTPGNVFFNEELMNRYRQMFASEGRGTVDELGFGDLYDSFSEQLFPWCSTLTSRARYYYFTLAVLDRALSHAAQPLVNAEAYSPQELLVKIESHRTRFSSVVRESEKFLALALYARYQQNGNGIFGYRRVNRWSKDNAPTQKSLGKQNYILSNDGRYANAIYRGGSRRLGMFDANANNSRFIKQRLIGESIFQEGWMAAAELARYQLNQVCEFWEQNEARELGAMDGIEQLRKRKWFNKEFGAFELSPNEADFLYDRIVETTPYWRSVKRSELSRLLKGNSIDLLKLEQLIPETQIDWRMLVQAGWHVDRVTSVFRKIYLVHSSKDQARAMQVAVDIDAIVDSWSWLIERSKKASEHDQTWKGSWDADVGPMIQKWISLLKKERGVGPKLIADIENRAVEIVSARGKLAPHERTDNGHEEDIREELDVRESSFRLSNAARILKDVVGAQR